MTEMLARYLTAKAKEAARPSRRNKNAQALPVTYRGCPRPGSALAPPERRHPAPEYEVRHRADGNTEVPLVGEAASFALIKTTDYLRVTHGFAPGVPKLTKTRWFRDDDGNVRAIDLKDCSPDAREFGVLVAAMVLRAKDGETITYMEGNALDLTDVMWGDRTPEGDAAFRGQR